MTTTDVQDLIVALDKHRGFLLQTAQGLTDEQARTASTVSSLTIASLLKHVADTEAQWVDFAQRGAEAFAWLAQMADGGQGADAQDADAPAEQADPRFVLTDADTLDVLRQRVLTTGERTAQVLATLDPDATHALPEAPWFEPGASWSVRRVALHLLAEISQHAGHADIIREAIDGARTMG